jgi:hypothetical protein
MPRTVKQSRAIVEAIAAAPSADALETLRQQARREGSFEVVGSFLELLIDFRQSKLERPNAATRRTPIV